MGESGPPEIAPLTYSRDELATAFGPSWLDRLLDSYRWMLLGRALDRRMLGLQRQGRIGFYGPTTGQEAVTVGSALALAPNDWVVPGLREQLIALIRGHPLPTYLHHLFADDLDPARGRQMPCHPTAREVRYVSMSSVIGTQITHAVGLAYAQKLRHDESVTLAFFGDGATSGNDFHAGLNFAGVFQLPVVFCLANNQWAISQPVERQTKVARLSDKAAAYGLPGQRLDGTDLVAVHTAVRGAAERARAGRGPALLEMVTYRMTPHSSSDDPTRYQPTSFLRQGEVLDPVGRLSDLLTRLGSLTPAVAQTMSEAADDQVRRAIAEAEAAPPPAASSLTSDLFAAASAPRGG